MPHPDERACLQGRTLFEMELTLAGAFTEDEEPSTVEVRTTRFDPPFLVRWPPREDDPGEEASWAVATNLLVTMKPEVAPREAEEILRDLASYGDPGAVDAVSVRTEPLPLPGLYLVERWHPADFEAENPRFLLTRLQTFPEHGAVAEANPDYLYFSLPEPRMPGARPWLPDSELERMRVPEAHAAGATGDHRVRVAVLDTGVEVSHEALWRNILWEDGRVVGYDFDRDRPDVQDGNGHGTYCAGLIGGAGYGVNREVSILPVRFLNAYGCGTTAKAVKAIGFALCHGAHVLSNSWGGVPSSPDLERMVARASSEGALFVAGAGNASRDLDTIPYYPASYRQDTMITVGAALDSDEPASESGYGLRSVHLAAPGESVLSTHHLPPDGEDWRSGTSVSTAFVAGACALVMARHPEWDHLKVRRRVIRSVVPMGDGTIGAGAACCAGGRLDVYNAALVDGLKPNLECPGKWAPR